jgi:plastocyanin
MGHRQLREGRLRAIACVLAASVLSACAQLGPGRRLPPAELHGTLRASAPLGLRGAIIYLEPIAPETATGALDVEVKILRGRFEPDPLVVLRGARVAWLNADSIYHGIFSLSRAGDLDLGSFGPGERREITLHAAGPLRVRCPLHVDESAVVLAVPGPRFVQVRGKQYALRGVPPGRYWLRVWSDVGSAAPRDITLRPGESAQADIALRAPRP